MLQKALSWLALIAVVVWIFQNPHDAGHFVVTAWDRFTEFIGSL